MSLGNEATRRIDDVLAAVRIVPSVDKLATLTFWAETQCLVGDQLVGGEAVVQFNDVHVIRGQSRALKESV